MTALDLIRNAALRIGVSAGILVALWPVGSLFVILVFRFVGPTGGVFMASGPWLGFPLYWAMTGANIAPMLTAGTRLIFWCHSVLAVSQLGFLAWLNLFRL